MESLYGGESKEMPLRATCGEVYGLFCGVYAVSSLSSTSGATVLRDTRVHMARTRVFHPDAFALQQVYGYDWQRCAFALSPAYGPLQRRCRILRVRFESDDYTRDRVGKRGVRSRSMYVTFDGRDHVGISRTATQYFRPDELKEQFDLFQRDYGSADISPQDDMDDEVELTGADVTLLLGLLEVTAMGQERE